MSVNSPSKVDPLYNVWCCMKKRCANKNSPDYSRYGGRGIKVCEAWQKFSAFEQDMRPSYRKGLSLDRINNSGDYCIENCKWSTPEEQANNTRNVARIAFGGKIMSVARWARFLGIKRSTLQARLHDYGWPIEKALTFNIN